jgi:hypothetical protein
MKPRLNFALPKAVVTKALRQLNDVQSLIVPGPYSGAFDDEETDGLVIGGKDVRQVQRLRSKASMAVSYAPCCTLYVVCFVAGLGGSWRLLPRPCRVRYWPSPPARRRRTLPTYTEQHYRARHQAISCNGLLKLLWLSQVLPKLLRAYQRLNGGASQLSKETIRSVALSAGINIVRKDKPAIKVYATLSWQRTNLGKFDSVRLRDGSASGGFAQLVLVFAAKLILPHTHTKECAEDCSLAMHEVLQDLALVRKFESSAETFSVAGVERTVTHLKWPKDGGYAVVSVTAVVGRCYVVQNYKLNGDNFLLNECIFGDE